MAGFVLTVMLRVVVSGELACSGARAAAWSGTALSPASGTAEVNTNNPALYQQAEQLQLPQQPPVTTLTEQTAGNFQQKAFVHIPSVSRNMGCMSLLMARPRAMA